MTRTDCYPWWHATYNALPRIAVSSGCSTSGGNVQCSPESMRAAAEAKLRVAGYWTGNRPLSLEAYTMARYITSEVGSGSVEDQAAVGEAAINQAAKWKLKNGILSLLLYRQSSAHPNYGYYGPIHGGSVASAPYDRWAATSKDPNVRTLMLADGILRGETKGFNDGAHTQWGAEYLPNPQGLIRKQAAAGNFWIGPLPGVDHWRTLLIRDYGKNHPDAAAMLAQGLAAYADKSARPKWGDLPLCSKGPSGLKLSGGGIVGVVLAGSLALAVVVYLGRSAALREEGLVALPAARLV